MIPWPESECHTSENQEELLHRSHTQFAWQLSDVPHTNDSTWYTGKSMLYTEDEKLMSDSISSNEMLLLNEWHSRLLAQDYVEKIKKFHLYVDMVKKITRPGCSPEILNVALSSMSSLVKTLSMVSSKRCMHSSL